MKVRRKPDVITGPVIAFPFFGFQGLENMPPRLFRSFSPCES